MLTIIKGKKNDRDGEQYFITTLYIERDRYSFRVRQTTVTPSEMRITGIGWSRRQDKDE